MARHRTQNPLRRPAVWVVSVGVHFIGLMLGAVIVLGAALRDIPTVTQLELRLGPVVAPPAPPPAPPSAPDTAVSQEQPPQRLVTPPASGAYVLTTAPLDESIDLGLATPAGPRGWGVAGGIVGGTGGAFVFQQPIAQPSAPEQPVPVARPPTPPEPVRVTGAIDAPALIHMVEPDYPAASVWARKQGTVGIELHVGVDGAVQEAMVVKPLDPLLDEAALAAVRQWQYEPLLIDSQPFPFLVDVTIRFALPPR